MSAFHAALAAVYRFGLMCGFGAGYAANRDRWKTRATAAEAKNAELREALKDALQLCYNCGGDPLYLERDEATGDDLWTRCPVCREPRAAIEENQRGQG